MYSKKKHKCTSIYLTRCLITPNNEIIKQINIIKNNQDKHSKIKISCTKKYKELDTYIGSIMFSDTYKFINRVKSTDQQKIPVQSIQHYNE